MAHAKPSVVNITTEALGEAYAIVPLFPITGPFGDAPPVERVFHPFVKRGFLPSVKPNLGSGLIISADGLILTNYHVIEDRQQPIVHLPATKESYWADIMGADPVSDLALLAIDAGHPLPTVRWGESARLMVGEWVVAIGNPYGLQESVTVGLRYELTGQAALKFGWSAIDAKPPLEDDGEGWHEIEAHGLFFDGRHETGDVNVLMMTLDLLF